MRKILNAEICKEKPNSAALGAFNSAVNTVVGNTENYYILNMKSFKENKKNRNKVKKSLKGLDKGLQNAILRSI